MRGSVELVFDARATLLECPAWEPNTATVSCVDIPAGIVHRWHRTSGQVSSTAVGQPVGAALPRVGGGLVLAVRDGIALLEGENVSIVAPVEADEPDHLMNDAKCDAAGRLWAGTTHRDEVAEAGTLYRIDADFDPEPMVTGVTISNGLGWSNDGTAMYYVDSATRRIDIFDFDIARGEISGRRPLVVLDDIGEAMPDGMCVDAEGGIWIALWGGGVVRRYNGAGTLDAEVRIPANLVTSCAFGGPELDELYVTTARGDGSDSGNGAGGLFRVRPGVTGQPSVPFRA